MDLIKIHMGLIHSQNCFTTRDYQGSDQTAFCQASATFQVLQIKGTKVVHLVHAFHYTFHLPFHDATSLNDDSIPGTFVAGIPTNKESLFGEKVAL